MHNRADTPMQLFEHLTGCPKPPPAVLVGQTYTYCGHDFTVTRIEGDLVYGDWQGLDWVVPSSENLKPKED